MEEFYCLTYRHTNLIFINIEENSYWKHCEKKEKKKKKLQTSMFFYFSFSTMVPTLSKTNISVYTFFYNFVCYSIWRSLHFCGV